MDMSRLNCRTGLSYTDQVHAARLPFTLPVKFRQPGDTAALGMDYHAGGKLAFVTAGAHGIGEAIANLTGEDAGGPSSRIIRYRAWTDPNDI